MARPHAINRPFLAAAQHDPDDDLPMTPDDVAAFVTEYSRYSRHAGAIDPQQLLERRDAYELLDRMGNLLYCLSRLGKARYGMWADEIARNLIDRLAD